MDPVTTFDVAQIFFGESEWVFLLEITFRVLVIYCFALVFLRAGGKKARKQMTPVEMLLIVALGSAVGDVMFYPTVALLYAALIIVTIVKIIVTRAALIIIRFRFLTLNIAIRFDRRICLINIINGIVA